MASVKSTSTSMSVSLIQSSSAHILMLLCSLLCVKPHSSDRSTFVSLRTNVDLSPAENGVEEKSHNASSRWSATVSPICNVSDDGGGGPEGGPVHGLRVCSMDSVPGDYGNTRRHLRVLVFRLENEHVKIFVGAQRVSLPNATVRISSDHQRTVPIHREFISRNLFSFYSGSLAVSDVSVPFTAHWDGSAFTGAAVHLSRQLELHCPSVDSHDFYTSDVCLHCSVTCRELTFEERDSNNGTDKDFLELFEVHVHRKTVLDDKVRNSYEDRRRKRDFPKDAFPLPLSCSLHLVADHLFFAYVGAKSVTRTLNTMLRLVNDVDAIFRSVDFDGEGFGDNVGFIVGKVDICSVEDDRYMLKKEYMTSDEYLRIFSTYFDFSEACLGVAFTYRDFGSISGISYPAFSDRDIVGGICQEPVEVNERPVSYNALAVTMYSNGRRLPHEVAVLNLMHELGHSFGARHDDTGECASPEEGYGSFIMHAESNTGLDPNNRRFSPCSLRSMLPVIKKKGGCLLNGTFASRCGNTIAEDDEECDCGATETCQTVDPCCTPSDVTGGPDRPCTIRRSAGNFCSPKKGPCCTPNCTFVPASWRQVCGPMDGCSDLSECGGAGGQCPPAASSADGTFCNNGMDVCQGGSCSVGICEYFNMSACLCTAVKDECKLCCKGGDNTCRPVGSYPFIENNMTVHHDWGVPCHDSGYCASTRGCTLPFTGGAPGAEIGLFGPDTHKHFKYHLNNYWFYYFLLALCFLILITFLTLSYRINDTDYLKALRYGKMLAVFAQGEYQSKVYRKMLVDINNYYTIRLHKVQSQSEPLSYFEAVARLKVLFPQVSTKYIRRLAKISASESMAVKILLIQGHRMRTFSE